MKRIAFVLVCITCFAACNNEVDIENTTVEPRIELLMPDAETVNVYSAASQNECKINEVWVIEFNSTTGALVDSEHINGANIVVNSQNQAAQMLPQLGFRPTNNNKIVCIANTGITPLPNGLTFTNYSTSFPLQSTYYSGGAPLPMHGVMDWTGTGYTCQMIRAVAKVQVQMGTSVSDNTTNFSAENVSFRIYNCAASGFFGANGSAQPNPSSYLTPSFQLLQKKNATESQINAYIHAYPSATSTGFGVSIASNKTFHKDRQSIILTKDNSGLSKPNTHYRLDFYRSGDSTFLNTEANRHYLFTINRVYSEGYNTEAEAIQNPGSNIGYTVRIEDGMSKVTSNGQYAVVTSADTVRVPAAVSNRPISLVRYEDPSGAMNVLVNSVTVSEATPSNSLTLVSPTQITASNVDVVVSTDSSFENGVILCRLGNVEHKLIVKNTN
jgi:hypothetical protein